MTVTSQWEEACSISSVRGRDGIRGKTRRKRKDNQNSNFLEPNWTFWETLYRSLCESFPSLFHQNWHKSHQNNLPSCIMPIFPTNSVIERIRFTGP